MDNRKFFRNFIRSGKKLSDRKAITDNVEEREEEIGCKKNKKGIKTNVQNAPRNKERTDYPLSVKDNEHFQLNP
jgi:hypothetical protein